DEYMWMLNQPFNYYVLDGEFVITYEWYDEVEGQIENVVINENGNAVVTLITKDFEYETITVVGHYFSSKLVDLKAFQNFNGDDDEVSSWIYLDKEEVDDDEIDWTLTLDDGQYAYFVTTQKGAYLESWGGYDVFGNFFAEGSVEEEFKVKGDYLYVNGTATYNVDDLVVIEREEADDEDDDWVEFDYENLTYSFSDKLPSADTLTVQLFDGWYDSVSDTLGDDVSVIALFDTYTEEEPEVVETVDGTIVYVNNPAIIDTTLTTTSYKVVDLFAGEEITVVLDDSKNITVKDETYYLVKNGKIVEELDSDWIMDSEDINLRSEYEGLVGTVKGNYMYLEDDTVEIEGATYGLEIVVYEVVDGDIVLDDGEAETIKVADYLLDGAAASFADFFDYEGYSVKGQMIILATEAAE
ncbi:MAG: hypothetical protein IJC98_08705, partial [Clostridia bacterium]|nr:hypothetical protein [Clostridia bacterium]